MTFLPAGVKEHGVTIVLDDKGARTQSLLTGIVISICYGELLLILKETMESSGAGEGSCIYPYIRLT